jgi:hypothetical protein
MSAGRFFAIAAIFVGVSVAWAALGGSMWVRTRDLDSKLSGEMAALWGPKVLNQAAPVWQPAGKGGTPTAPSASTITADIHHDSRYKGLLWYSTFSVDFQGSYTIPAAAKDAADASTAGAFVFPLPPGASNYDKLRLGLDGKALEIRPQDIAGGKLQVPLDRSAEHVVAVGYQTSGQEMWLYSPGGGGVYTGRDDLTGDADDNHEAATGELCSLKDFKLTVTTDFADIDYPKGSRSPSAPAGESSAGGKQAVWAYTDAMTRQAMGVVVPRKMNAGPIAARMSFFAPVSLFFFFAVLFAVVVLRKIPLHPMHYLFIAAGFFAFHILMAYLTELVNIHAAFWICAAVSVFLVVSYMRLVAGVKVAVLYVGVAQLVYLVGFSYAFFWAGYTGLTVTVGAIATLFVLMQATGKVKWAEVFARRNGTTYPPPPPLPPRV